MTKQSKKQSNRRGFLAVGILGSFSLLLRKRTPRLLQDENDFVQVLNAQGELVEVPRSSLESGKRTSIRSNKELRTWLRNNGQDV